jgi:hypothetical protein
MMNGMSRPFLPMLRELWLFPQPVATCALTLLAPASAHAQASTPARAPVSLVVLVAVDQLRPDYFARFGSQFTGGFALVRARSA